jgi:hypothetical protein
MPELPLVPLAEASSGTFASTELAEELAISGMRAYGLISC